MTELTESQRETLFLFKAGAERLEKLVDGLTDKELDSSEAPGEWTIRQIIHHIAEDGDAWSMNFKKAIAIPGAHVRFEGFPGNEAWADALAFDRRSVKTSLALIRAHRQVMAELAERFADSWEQYVIIVDSDGKELQKVSAGQIINMLGEHMEEHIAKIEEIKNMHGI
jgi:hypothetical protein